MDDEERRPSCAAALFTLMVVMLLGALALQFIWNKLVPTQEMPYWVACIIIWLIIVINGRMRY